MQLSASKVQEKDLNKMREITYSFKLFLATDLKPIELEFRMLKNIWLQSEKVLVDEYLQSKRK
jgi:hypothetical protein